MGWRVAYIGTSVGVADCCKLCTATNSKILSSRGWHSISTAFGYSGKQAMKLTIVGYGGKQAMKLTTLCQVKLYNYISTRSLRVPASDCRNFKICVLFDVISPKPCTS